MEKETSLLETLHGLESTAIERYSGRFVDWNKCAKIGMLLEGGTTITTDIIGIGEIDCLLCAIEKEGVWDANVIIPNVYLSLIKSWVFRAYETLRTTKQRILSQPKIDSRLDWTDDCDGCFATLETLRIQLAKKEFRGYGKLGRAGPDEIISGENSLHPAYNHGRTILSESIYTRPDDKSLGWLLYFADTDVAKKVFRVPVRGSVNPSPLGDGML